VKDLVLEDLVLDKEALEKAGLYAEEVYMIGYDLPSAKKVSKKKGTINGRRATAPEVEEALRLNKITEHYRNKMKYLLKWKLMATKHLESSWIITKDRIKEAVAELSELKSEMKPIFRDIDRRIRIVPLWTTEQGYETFEELKAQFLMDFATQHIASCDKGLDAKKMDSSKIWRCKKAYEYIHILADELRNKSLRNEVKDTVALLGDKIAQVEAMLLDIENEAKENQ
jgi:hypothetical protein